MIKIFTFKIFWIKMDNKKKSIPKTEKAKFAVKKTCYELEM